MHPETLSSVTPGDVYNYFLKAGGIATEASYPFINYVQRGRQCIFNYTMDGIQILGPGGYERVPNNDEEMMKRALRQRGPISATFTVATDFYSY
jgi:hypothetical protein